MTVWSLRLVGGVLLYAAIFLYETEEGAIQNRLERLWVDMQAVHARAVSANVAFVNETARLLGEFLDRIFGPKLFSARSCLVSYLYSMGFALLGIPLLFAFGLSRPVGLGVWMWIYSALLGLAMIGAPTVSVLLGGAPGDLLLPGSSLITSLPWYFQWENAKGVSTTIVMSSLLMLIGAGLLDRDTSMLVVSVAFLSAAVLSFVSDVLFIVLMRWILRQTSEYRKPVRIAAALASICLLGFILSSVPWLATGSTRLLGRLELRGLFFSTLRLLGLFNLVDLVISVIVVLMFLTLPVHKSIWSVIERPIYACARYDVIRNKKLLWVVGSALIVGPPSFLKFGHWFLEQLVKFG